MGLFSKYKGLINPAPHNLKNFTWPQRTMFTGKPLAPPGTHWGLVYKQQTQHLDDSLYQLSFLK